MKKMTIIFTLIAMLILLAIPSTVLCCCRLKVVGYTAISECECDILWNDCKGYYERKRIFACRGSCTSGTCQKVGTYSGVVVTQWPCLGSCAGGIENCEYGKGNFINGPVPICGCKENN